ncbi:MAG: hypothetical protein IJX78_00315 [Bacilli bacterium]|nr:hypothetical protein [Bacilli bacterium]
MSNFDNLKQYILPSDLLLDMLNIYKLIGKNSVYEESLKKNIKSIENATLERDVFFLCLLLDVNVTDNRLRLIITKNSTPRNTEEKIVANLKSVLKQIRTSAPLYGYNSSDLLSYINSIYGAKYARFSTSMVKGDRKKRIPDQSLRLKINNVLDDYHVYFEKELYERIFLSLMTYIELVNINPFTKGNEVASYLALYYMILRCEVDCFRYISFFEVLYTNLEVFNREKIAASMNYREGFIQIFSLSRLIYSLIAEGYKKLEAIIKEYSYEESVNKSDNVENTIYQLPNIFTKDDIRSRHPFVSEATINRILVKLRDQEYITPLGKGRSAKWIKTQKHEINYNQIIQYNEDDDDLPF